MATTNPYTSTRICKDCGKVMTNVSNTKLYCPECAKKPPNDLVSSQNIADVSDAIIIADELVKREPAYLYKVFDSSMNVVYMR